MLKTLRGARRFSWGAEFIPAQRLLVPRRQIGSFTGAFRVVMRTEVRAPFGPGCVGLRSPRPATWLLCWQRTQYFAASWHRRLRTGTGNGNGGGGGGKANRLFNGFACRHRGGKGPRKTIAGANSVNRSGF